jgi:hypothetical protein
MKKIYVILLFSFIPFFALGILAARYYVQHEPFVGVVKANSAQVEYQTRQTTLVLIQADDLSQTLPKLARMDVLFILDGEVPSIKIMQIFPSNNTEVDLLLVSQFALDPQNGMNEEFDHTLQLAYDFQWDGEILIDQTSAAAILAWSQNKNISTTTIPASSTADQPDHSAKIIESVCNILAPNSQIDLSQFPDANVLDGHYLLSTEHKIFNHLSEVIQGGQHILDCEVLPPG